MTTELEHKYYSGGASQVLLQVVPRKVLALVRQAHAGVCDVLLQVLSGSQPTAPYRLELLQDLVVLVGVAGDHLAVEGVLDLHLPSQGRLDREEREGRVVMADVEPQPLVVELLAQELQEPVEHHRRVALFGEPLCVQERDHHDDETVGADTAYVKAPNVPL